MGNKIITEIVAQITPQDLISLHRQYPDRYPHFLESLPSEHSSSRYSILFAYPSGSISLTNNKLATTGQYAKKDFLNNIAGESFLDAFQAAWRQESEHAQSPSHALPFLGGWFVYLSYELIREIEPCLADIPVSKTRPAAYAVRHPAAFIFDQQQQTCTLLVEREYAHLLDKMRADIARLKTHRKTQAESTASVEISPLKVEEDAEQNYLEGVERIKHYIYEGDIFQANLSREWRITLPANVSDQDVYMALRNRNPAPFAGVSVFENTAIISSSPERLVKVNNNIIETRPIAGTRPRSNNKAEDIAYAEALMQHPKERAEHVMLLDLERNDIGRVCRYGTVKVDECMVLESYQHVHHIVSNIRGELRDEITPVDVIKAVFPGGTITGCPKIRCMEILAELEQKPREAYTGSFGYINRDGSMDLNILIRSIVKQGAELSIKTGAGIVADSIPEKELQETRSKAKGMLKAVGVELP